MSDPESGKTIDFCCTVGFEVVLPRGQIISGFCLPDRVDEIKKAMGYIKYLDFPVTHEVMVSHGGYGHLSRFNIKQIKYAGGGHGGCGGFIEILKIKNPPDGRWGVVIHEYDTREGHKFHEFTSIKAALEAWEGDFSLVAKAPGCMRSVVCGGLSPWFYAVANQALWKDYAFPNWLCDDPVYRPGRKFVVKDPILRIEEVKVCLGMSEVWYGEEKSRRVWWDDGTIFKEDELRYVRPLNRRDFWQEKVRELFDQVLAGKIDTMRIQTADGKVISIEAGKSASCCLTLDSQQQTLSKEEKLEALIKVQSRKRIKGGKRSKKPPIVIAVATTVIAGEKVSWTIEKEKIAKEEVLY